MQRFRGIGAARALDGRPLPSSCAPTGSPAPAITTWSRDVGATGSPSMTRSPWPAVDGQHRHPLRGAVRRPLGGQRTGSAATASAPRRPPRRPAPGARRPGPPSPTAAASSGSRSDHGALLVVRPAPMSTGVTTVPSTASWRRRGDRSPSRHAGQARPCVTALPPGRHPDPTTCAFTPLARLPLTDLTAGPGRLRLANHLLATAPDGRPRPPPPRCRMPTPVVAALARPAAPTRTGRRGLCRGRTVPARPPRRRTRRLPGDPLSLGGSRATRPAPADMRYRLRRLAE